MNIETDWNPFPQEPVGMDAPNYPTASDIQCLRLSELLHKERQEVKAMRAELSIMREGLQAITAELEAHRKGVENV